MYAGIDIGGTKIEACLFDQTLTPIVQRRIPTPRDSYLALLHAITNEALWLRKEAQQARLPIGICTPGMVDAKSGQFMTANLPVTGQSFKADLDAAIGPLVIANDAQCFALSEAQNEVTNGVTSTHQWVFGLILGTGVGGGLCHQGRLVQTHNRLAGEIGHIALPAQLVHTLGLPLLTCGCGRQGCYETLIAGTGLSQLAYHFAGIRAEPPDIVQAYLRSNVLSDATPQQAISRVINVWLMLVAELLFSVQLTIDPDCIVIGGGLSQIPKLSEQLQNALQARQLPAMYPPLILPAKYGDSSGIRGAALLTRTLQSSQIQSSQK